MNGPPVKRRIFEEMNGPEGLHQKGSQHVGRVLRKKVRKKKRRKKNSRFRRIKPSKGGRRLLKQKGTSETAVFRGYQTKTPMRVHKKEEKKKKTKKRTKSPIILV